MAALNQASFKNLPGEAIGALINDYLEGIADWEKSVIENFKTCYSAARSFVLPMNPPRFELDHAVRRFFTAHGVPIKKSHIIDLNASQGRAPAESAVKTAAKSSSTDIPRKRRKRRRKKPAPIAAESN
jgi:poly(A) polymerase